MGATIAQADHYVTSGNADAGLVALSLVMHASLQSPSIGRTYTIIDASLHDPVRHVGAIVSRSRNVEAGYRFLQFLMSAQGQHLLRKHGFASPDSVVSRSH
jgi:molybdate transport system substrate-binding protein